MKADKTKVKLYVNGLTIFLNQRQITHHGRHVELSKEEHALLILLIENASAVISKYDILSTVWPDNQPQLSAVKVLVSNLRKKLHESAATPIFIATIDREGYQWIAKPEKQNVKTARPIYFKLLLIIIVIFLSVFIVNKLHLSQFNTYSFVRSQLVLDSPAAVTPKISSSLQYTLYFNASINDKEVSSLVHLVDVERQSRLRHYENVLAYQWHPSDNLFAIVQNSRQNKQCTLKIISADQGTVLQQIGCPPFTNINTDSVLIDWNIDDKNTGLLLTHLNKKVLTTYLWSFNDSKWQRAATYELTHAPHKVTSFWRPSGTLVLATHDNNLGIQLHQLSWPEEKDMYSIDQWLGKFIASSITHHENPKETLLRLISPDQQLFNFNYITNEIERDTSFLGGTSQISQHNGSSLLISSVLSQNLFLNNSKLDKQLDGIPIYSFTPYHLIDNKLILKLDTSTHDILVAFPGTDSTYDILQSWPHKTVTHVNGGSKTELLVTTKDGIYLGDTKIIAQGDNAQFLSVDEVIFSDKDEHDINFIYSYDLTKKTTTKLTGGDTRLPRVNQEGLCFLERASKTVRCHEIHQRQSATIQNINHWLDYYIKDDQITAFTRSDYVDKQVKHVYEFTTGNEIQRSLVSTVLSAANPDVSDNIYLIPSRTSHVLIQKKKGH